MQFHHMQVIFMLREFGGSTDPVEVTLKVIKATCYAGGFLHSQLTFVVSGALA